MLIEISGTPGSGKNSIIHYLQQNNLFISCEVIESDDSEFNYKNSNFELRILWSIFDTYSRINKLICNQESNNDFDLKIFNRGLFDRIAWSRLLCTVNSNYQELSEYIEKWLKDKIILLNPEIIFVILTSYDKTMMRKRKNDLNKLGWVINEKSIEYLNKIYLDLFMEMKSSLKLVLIDDLNYDISLSNKLEIVKYYLTLNKKK